MGACCILKALLLLWFICLDPLMLVWDPTIESDRSSEICYEQFGSKNSSSSKDEMLYWDLERRPFIGAEFIICRSSLDSSLNETLMGFDTSVFLYCLFIVTLLSSGSITWEITRFLLLFLVSMVIGTSLNSNASHRKFVVLGIAFRYTSIIVCLNQVSNFGNRLRPSSSWSAFWTSSKN